MQAQVLLDAIWMPSFLNVPIDFGRHSTGFYCEYIEERMFCWEQRDIWPHRPSERSADEEWYENRKWNLEVLRCWFNQQQDQLLREQVLPKIGVLDLYDELQRHACIFLREAAEYRRDIDLVKPRMDWREIKEQLSRGDEPDPTDMEIGNIPYLITEEPRLLGKIAGFLTRVRMGMNTK
jgi:hypothetical protein